MGKYENADSKIRIENGMLRSLKKWKTQRCFFRIAMLQGLQLKVLCGTFRSRVADEELSTKQVIEPEDHKEPG